MHAAYSVKGSQDITADTSEETSEMVVNAVATEANRQQLGNYVAANALRKTEEGSIAFLRAAARSAAEEDQRALQRTKEASV